MATCRKQFDEIKDEECVTKLTSDVDKFIPEMSMPVKDILMQFGFVDNVRLVDLARRGYSIGADDDSDFDYPDFDTMDIAEKHEYAEHCADVVRKYQEQMKHQKENPEETETPAVDESILP